MMSKVLDIKEMAQTPIPEIPSMEGWQDVPIAEDNDPFLVSCEELGIPYAAYYAGTPEFSPYAITGHGAIKGAMHHGWVRASVVDALVRAQVSLPDNISIVVVDAKRPKDPQASLRDFFDTRLKELRPDWSQEARDKYADTYVSKPQENAPHDTAATVDSWLMGLPVEFTHSQVGKLSRMGESRYVLKHGVWLPSGKPFDNGGVEASLRHYEEHDDSPADQAARENRRIKFWIMTGAGLWPYPGEFWEYALGTQKARKAAGSDEPARYGSIDLSPVQQRMEAERAAEAAQDPQKYPTPGFPMGEIIQPVF